MARSSQQLFDTLDIVFLGTLGLGTIAWFARHQIADKIFKSAAKPEIKATDARTGPPKKERNFVKVMQQEVTLYFIFQFLCVYLFLLFVGS